MCANLGSAYAGGCFCCACECVCVSVYVCNECRRERVCDRHNGMGEGASEKHKSKISLQRRRSQRVSVRECVFAPSLCAPPPPPLPSRSNWLRAGAGAWPAAHASRPLLLATGRGRRCGTDQPSGPVATIVPAAVAAHTFGRHSRHSLVWPFSLPTSGRGRAREKESQQAGGEHACAPPRPAGRGVGRPPNSLTRSQTQCGNLACASVGVSRPPVCVCVLLTTTLALAESQVASGGGGSLRGQRRTARSREAKWELTSGAQLWPRRRPNEMV